MHYAFPFLPLELQTSIKELAALGVPESAVDLLVERASKAIEAKTISAQRDVIEIGEEADRRVDQISTRLEDRLRIILGDTNGMLVDIRTGVQNQETALSQARAEFHNGMQSVGERVSDIEDWREKVDETLASFRQSRDESKEQRTRTENAVQDLAAQFTAFTEHIDALIAQGPTPEQAQQYRAFLDELMSREKQAGG